MRTWRTGRIDLPQADRLVAGDVPDPEHAGLGELLSAARAPASAGELAGERAAVAGFVAARRSAESTPKGSTRARVSLFARATVVKVAAGALVLVAGGAGYATETGRLPAGLQERAHHMLGPLGVPGPSGGASPGGTASPMASGTARPSPSRGATPGGGTVAGTGETPEQLCQDWRAAQKDPQGAPLSDAQVAALQTLAGSSGSIASYCARQDKAGGSTSTGAPATPQATATPSHPGNGNGNAGGNGNGHAHPTPTPHH